MKIERPPTGYQTHTLTQNEGDKMKTYHQLTGMWGEQLWHEGEWAIYRLMMQTDMINFPNRPKRYDTTFGHHSVLVHSKIWEEEIVAHKDSAEERGRWRVKDNDDIEPGYFTTEKIEKVCHTQIYPVNESQCDSCCAKIPEGAIAMWKMLNWEHLREEA